MRKLGVVLLFILIFVSCKKQETTTLHKLTNDSNKYWLYVKTYRGGDIYKGDVLSEYNETVYILNLKKNGFLDNLYKGNLCAPIFKDKFQDEQDSCWQLLNDTAIIIGYDNYKIEHLTNDVMVLSWKVDSVKRYYSLYIKAPEELITNDKLCNIEFPRPKREDDSSDNNTLTM